MRSASCMVCGKSWQHNAGPRDSFTTITKVCPVCIPAYTIMIREQGEISNELHPTRHP